MTNSKPFAVLDWEGRTDAMPPAAPLIHLASVFPKGDLEPLSQPIQNTLIQGENLAVMLALLPDFEGRIDLIYADPPFLSGKAYTARIGRDEDSRRPTEWRQTEGFQDLWEDGSEYLRMLYPRLKIMHQLLSETGTFYLHLDWHAAAYARVILDEIFGPERLLNEIVWTYHGPSPIQSAFKRKHDTILVYTKSEEYTFNADAVRIPYNRSTYKTFQSSKKAGFGKRPNLKRGKVPEDWWYFPVVARLHNERTGYPTQKPEALMERIILASSHPGDLTADFFCGSGTTPIVAQRLGRGWLACDASQLAVLTTKRRILLEPGSPPFQFLHQTSLAQPEELTLSIMVEHDGLDIQIHMQDIHYQSGKASALPDLVLWEIDWNYKDLPSHLSSAASLPWREGAIQYTASHRYSKPGERVIFVQAFLASGESGIWTKTIKV